jgi:hypothetical protein
MGPGVESNGTFQDVDAMNMKNGASRTSTTCFSQLWLGWQRPGREGANVIKLYLDLDQIMMSQNASFFYLVGDSHNKHKVRWVPQPHGNILGIFNSRARSPHTGSFGPVMGPLPGTESNA